MFHQVFICDASQAPNSSEELKELETNDKSTQLVGKNVPNTPDLPNNYIKTEDLKMTIEDLKQEKLNIVTNFALPLKEETCVDEILEPDLLNLISSDHIGDISTNASHFMTEDINMAIHELKEEALKTANVSGVQVKEEIFTEEKLAPVVVEHVNSDHVEVYDTQIKSSENPNMNIPNILTEHKNTDKTIKYLTVEEKQTPEIENLECSHIKNRSSTQNNINVVDVNSLDEQLKSLYNIKESFVIIKQPDSECIIPDMIYPVIHTKRGQKHSTMDKQEKSTTNISTGTISKDHLYPLENNKLQSSTKKIRLRIEQETDNDSGSDWEESYFGKRLVNKKKISQFRNNKRKHNENYNNNARKKLAINNLVDSHESVSSSSSTVHKQQNELSLQISVSQNEISKNRVENNSFAATSCSVLSLDTEDDRESASPNPSLPDENINANEGLPMNVLHHPAKVPTSSYITNNKTSLQSGSQTKTLNSNNLSDKFAFKVLLGPNDAPPSSGVYQLIPTKRNLPLTNHFTLNTITTNHKVPVQSTNFTNVQAISMTNILPSINLSTLNTITTNHKAPVQSSNFTNVQAISINNILPSINLSTLNTISSNHKEPVLSTNLTNVQAMSVDNILPSINLSTLNTNTTNHKVPVQSTNLTNVQAMSMNNINLSTLNTITTNHIVSAQSTNLTNVFVISTNNILPPTNHSTLNNIETEHNVPEQSTNLTNANVISTNIDNKISAEKQSESNLLSNKKKKAKSKDDPTQKFREILPKPLPVGVVHVSGYKDENERIFDEMLYSCIKCSRLFFNSSSYKDHMNYSLCGGYRRKCRFQCDLCGKLFTGKEKLNNHKNSHTNARPFKCSDCDQYFNSKGARQMHHKKMHLNKKNLHLCYYCGYLHPNLKHLKAHEAIHRLPEGAEVPKPFKCLTCGKGFISKYKLSHHQKEHKPVSLKCSVCSEVFDSRKKLTSHKINVHNIFKNYECKECGKKFKHHSYLNYHMKSHNQVRFICDICDKAFKTKAHIAQHMITHTDERPITCEHCGDKFKRLTHLKQHMEAFHGKGRNKKKISKQ